MIDVILGDNDWSTRREVLELRRHVTEIIVHPQFGQRATFDYDFAILGLSWILRQNLLLQSSQFNSSCILYLDINIDLND